MLSGLVYSTAVFVVVVSCQNQNLLLLCHGFCIPSKIVLYKRHINPIGASQRTLFQQVSPLTLSTTPSWRRWSSHHFTFVSNTHDGTFDLKRSAHGTANADSSFVLSKEECHPIIRIGSKKMTKKSDNDDSSVADTDTEKVINAFGLWCLFVSLITFPIWIFAMSSIQMIQRLSHHCRHFTTSTETTDEETNNDHMNDDGRWDPQYAIFDTAGKLWAKVWLRMIHSYPTVSMSNVELEEDRDGTTTTTSISSTTASSTGILQTAIHPGGNTACLYVANHASWLDIPILCTVLSPVFKFIAKGELRHVPGIGQQLQGVRCCY
jgi:Acyltransferase